MRQLCISHAESRRLHGSENYPMPSRFLREIPPEVLQEVRARPQVSRSVYRPRGGRFSDSQDSSGFHLGQQVSHPKFGDGVVLNAEGSGTSARVQVNFESVGSKWLVVAYANLQPA
jgi:DNA helicase-2/ATP-dependent DNA helicase PcrA